jgi:hypothetical protein
MGIQCPLNRLGNRDYSPEASSISGRPVDSRQAQAEILTTIRQFQAFAASQPDFEQAASSSRRWCGYGCRGT